MRCYESKQPQLFYPLNDVRLNKTDVNVIKKTTKIDFHSKGNEVSLKNFFVRIVRILLHCIFKMQCMAKALNSSLKVE